MKNSDDFLLYVFPTTFYKEINIRVLGTKEPIPFNFLNISGDLIFSGKVVEIEKIETELLPIGIYFVHYKQHGESQYIKLIKKIRNN